MMLFIFHVTKFEKMWDNKSMITFDSLIASNFNSLTTEKQTTKFSSANFQKMLNPSYIILRIQRLMANSIDLDEVAHEPPHQDLRCL